MQKLNIIPADMKLELGSIGKKSPSFNRKFLALLTFNYLT